MILQDAIINRVYLTKSGETVISFKVKPEDLPPEQREILLEYWRDGVLLQFAVERFQDENQEDTAKEETPLKSREKTVYERLRWEVVKESPEDEKARTWEEFKMAAATSRGKNAFGGLHGSDLWTPEEAEKLIAQFQGYDS